MFSLLLMICIFVVVLQINSFLHQNRIILSSSISSSSSSISSSISSSSLSESSSYIYCKPNENDMKRISQLISSNFDGPFNDNNIIDNLRKRYSEYDNYKKLEYRFNYLLNDNMNTFKKKQYHSMIVAKDSNNNNEVVGFIEMGMVMSSEKLKEKLLTINIYNKELPHIGNLVVAESYRRKGIANRLMKEMLHIVESWEDIPVILVAVEPINLAAKSLYEKVGFNFLLYEERVPFSNELNRDRLILILKRDQ